MKRTRVESSSIVSVGYDRKKEILELEFIGGAVYQYFEVPEEEYRWLIDADSKGRYVNQNIKDNYRFMQVQ
jgi:hypothetical protein